MPSHFMPLFPLKPDPATDGVTGEVSQILMLVMPPYLKPDC